MIINYTENAKKKVCESYIAFETDNFFVHNNNIIIIILACMHWKGSFVSVCVYLSPPIVLPNPFVSETRYRRVLWCFQI